MRDHAPTVIDTFNGLWDRGSSEEAPLDHFTNCQNINYVGTKGIAVRPGIGIHQDVSLPLSNVKRIYNYPTQTANTLIALVVDNLTGEGKIYHVLDSDTVYGPILTKVGMTDFAFVPYAGRAYISPFSSFAHGDLFVEKGLQNEFVYVYAGDGTAARKAAGVPLAGSLTINNGAAGNTDAGFHLFAWVAETASGYLTPPGAITGFTTAANFSVTNSNVPTSGDPNITKRHLVATKKIDNYSGNTLGYQFYFVPNATIPNDVDNFLESISFFDVDLIEDASYLLDNYAEIPAGAGMTMYRGRLIVYTTYTDISIALVSTQGEPEAISQTEGIIVVTLDGNPITNAQEMRDILYVFKRARTVAYADNGDVPATWEPVTVDSALGASIHGIATVLDSGSASVDKLIIANYKGINIFNGQFTEPELSYKVQGFWTRQNRNEFRKIQIVNEPISQKLYCILPDQRVLVGNYANGMSAKSIRWSPWSFQRSINTMAIVNIDQIILGLDLA